jgi:hypothetical protein
MAAAACTCALLLVACESARIPFAAKTAHAEILSEKGQWREHARSNRSPAQMARRRLNIGLPLTI